MKCAIMQPTFNPWLGYFDLIDYVDKFIFLDTVQLNQQSWQTRNKFKFQNRDFLFSLPIIKSKSKEDLMIKDTLLDFRKFDFRKKLFRSIDQNYKKAKFYNEVIELISDTIYFQTEFLSEYNINMIQQICLALDITTEIILSSDMDNINGKKGDLVLNICKKIDTNIYVSPLGSSDYLEKQRVDFNREKIEIRYQYYNHPSYQQLGDEFIPYIGIIDLLMNEGFVNSKKIILSGRKYENR